MLRSALEQEGYAVDTAADGARGIELASTGSHALVLTDLKLPEASGLEVVQAVQKCAPEVPVVVLTAHGTVRAAVAAMKLGAADFLEKPVEIDELVELIESHLSGESVAVRFQAPGAPPLIGGHPLLRAAIRLLQKVAPTESTVLLTGESGTGKELFARTLHALSSRSEGPFVAVNCAAIPETLLENELFGHEKGAFTGAHRRQAGRFEQAAGGTLLLDEIGELDLGIQGKILRVLEERAFERVGGSRTLTADVRIVAATNRDLERMTQDGSFRADLYYRLEVFPIELPSLRDRVSDIPVLARHLLEEVARRHRRRPLKLAPAAEKLLCAQPWPGNVRQLSNLLERAAILAEGSTITERELRELNVLGGGEGGEGGERERVRQALIDSGGDKQEAARRLEISYRTLQRRIKEFDLEGVPRFRS